MNKHFLILASATALLAGCGQGDSWGAEEANVAAEATRDFMIEVVDPQAQIVWRAAGSYSDETGLYELRPTTEEGWQAAENAAAALAEASRTMANSPYSDGRGEDWITFTDGLVTMAERNRQALADRASDDDLLMLGGDLYNVCKACHEAYPQIGEGAQSELEGPTAE